MNRLKYPAFIPDHVADEERIVWTRDPWQLAASGQYVREIEFCGTRRNGRPQTYLQIIGWAELKPRNRRGNPPLRRMFYVKSHDPYGPFGPCEAVDPRTVAPGVHGVHHVDPDLPNHLPAEGTLHPGVVVLGQKKKKKEVTP